MILDGLAQTGVAKKRIYFLKADPRESRYRISTGK